MVFALATLIAALPAVAADAVVEEYIVNAQYRDGAIHKAFRDLGRGKASYEPTGPASFRVKMKGEVRHPDGNTHYAFTLFQTFQLAGNDVKLTATEKRELNEHARPHESWISELVPFAYLARKLPIPAITGEDTSRTMRYQGTSFTLRYGKSERQVEVTLLKKDETVGKFFFSPGASKGWAPLDKFRMWFPRAKIMITFSVAKSSGTI
jgi:hypothetical protein